MNQELIFKEGGQSLEIDFNVTDSALAELREEYDGLDAGKDYEGTKKAIAVCRKLRTQVDAKRKELNKPALQWQRTVNAEAKRIIGQIRMVEDPMKDSKEAIDRAEEMRKAEERRQREIEEQRKREEEQARINQERAELEAEKRRIEEEKRKLGLANQEQEANAEPAPSNDNQQAPAGQPEMDEQDARKLSQWLYRALFLSPHEQLKSDWAQALCESVEKSIAITIEQLPTKRPVSF